MSKLPNHIFSLDIETAATNFENPEKSKIAIVGLMKFKKLGGKYQKMSYRCFLNDQLQQLAVILESSKYPIIGYNIFAFDLRVLAPHIPLNKIIARVIDPFAFMYLRMFRWKGLSLDNVARANKVGHKKILGGQIGKMWRAGHQKKVISYNQKDCELAGKLWAKLVLEKKIKMPEEFGSVTFSVSADDLQFLTGEKAMTNYARWKIKIKKEGYALFKNETKTIPLPDDESFPLPNRNFYFCPKCQCMDLIDEKPDIEGVSEGQYAEIEAGNGWTCYCERCGTIFDNETREELGAVILNSHEYDRNMVKLKRLMWIWSFKAKLPSIDRSLLSKEEKLKYRELLKVWSTGRYSQIFFRKYNI